jgi:hypothetical protein
MVASRRLDEACRRNVVCMALSAGPRPHCTTLAGVVSQRGHASIGRFCAVLLYGEELGLMGKEHFAIDGCKLPSHASTPWTGDGERWVMGGAVQGAAEPQEQGEQEPRASRAAFSPRRA